MPPPGATAGALDQKSSWRRATIDAARLLKIVRVALVFGLGHGPLLPLQPARWRARLRGVAPPPALSAPARLRLALEDLSGTFLKLGQFLAMRYDLLPAAYCDELSRLFEQAPSFHPRQACAIIAEELGAPPDVLFATFELEPLASASFGQVHRAKLKSGAEVAVKVQRPGIRTLVLSDIRWLTRIAALLHRLRMLGTFDPQPALAEFTRWTLDELDFTREAEQAEILRQSGDRQREVYPRVFWQLTTRRLLTTEFLPGPTLRQLLQLVETGGPQALERTGIDPQLIARNLVLNAARQIFVTGVFHADPHPANMLAMPGNRIGYVDFGIVGRLDAQRRRALERYVTKAAYGEHDEAIDAILSISQPSEETDLPAFRRALRSLLRRWHQAAGRSSGRATSSVATVTFQILAAMRRHRVATPTDVISFFKTLITVDSIAARLYPAQRTTEVLASQYRAQGWRREPLRAPRSWLGGWYEGGRVLGRPSRRNPALSARISGGPPPRRDVQLALLVLVQCLMGLALLVLAAGRHLPFPPEEFVGLSDLLVRALR